ncbi:uncharacterized protein isoform X2 [Rhodnius prolixus]|uniref:uncharacterized protein isoform X2 n=1 Tax=Rhodnius prolixus TaxID=13249 RepID=UPI003D18B9BF
MGGVEGGRLTYFRICMGRACPYSILVVLTQTESPMTTMMKTNPLFYPTQNLNASLTYLKHRSQFRSSLELKTYHQQQQQQQQQESNQQQNHQGTARRRTPSLPPINTNYEYIVQEDEGREGDTSGYASDNAANEYPIGETWTKQNGNWPLPNFSRKTPESVSSCSGGREEQRARWGDRGVGVGHLWAASPHLPQAPLPQIDRATPSWLHRGLMQEPAQVLVISHEDSYSNNQDMSRSCETLVSAEEFHRSYLRGQNTPIDPHSLAEREKKRQKALEQQNAIKQQLEEKERKKREEQERRLREERIEEERLRRHQELEIQRLEEEQRRAKEKEEKEERIAKAMREAIELAERTAREEKAKARRKHISERRPPTPRPTVKTITVSSPSAASDDSSSLLGERIEKSESNTMQQTTTLVVASAAVSNANDAAALVEARHQENIAPQELESKEKQESQNARVEQRSTTPEQQQVTLAVSADPPPPSPPPPPSTKLSETTSVILLAPAAASTPQKTATSPSRLSPLPSAITPLTLAIEELALEPGEIEVSRLGVLASPAGRVLTPSKFRSNVKREQATQTEQSSNKSRRERRSLRLEDRPKWGVNIPMTQYVKASDRDPHRRATRSRGRQQPDTEDSRSPSPLNNSKCSFSSFSPINRSVNGSNRVQSRTTRGVGTPRVIQVLPHGGQVRKSSASRRYLTIKGHSRTINRPPGNNVLPKRPDLSELITVKEVLSQLTALKNGLTMKQKEWELTRSPTPYSEMSSKS